MRQPAISIVLALLLLCASDAYGQGYSDPEAASGRDTTWYTVAGERHGISFFPRVRHPGVEYEAGDALTFDRYHSADVMYAWLQGWAEEYPNLMELYEVGRSYEGRPILQVTLTNKETGKDTDKPAAFEGGRHSGEITSSESILWLIQHLLESYGEDEEITRLLDTSAIYLRPQNNPDGSSLYLHTAQANRSTVRPHDSDRDGLIDEDPYEDLDGDGVIYQLRRHVREGADEKGDWTLDERDPSGRLIKRVIEGEGDWIVVSEGIDNDGDDDYNEDGIGGLDLHRNYPGELATRPRPGRDRSRLHPVRRRRIPAQRDRDPGHGALPARTPERQRRQLHGHPRTDAPAAALHIEER
jgi:hypothetical protein